MARLEDDPTDRDRGSRDLGSAIVEIFDANPFRKASVATLRTHLLARGIDRSEVEVRNCCERLVEEGVLEFEQQVYDRPKYSRSSR